MASEKHQIKPEIREKILVGTTDLFGDVSCIQSLPVGPYLKSHLIMVNPETKTGTTAGQIIQNILPSMRYSCRFNIKHIGYVLNNLVTFTPSFQPETLSFKDCF